MTKKKALMYLIILVIAVSTTAILKKVYFKDEAALLPDPCQNVISPSCQQYIAEVTEHGSKQEAAYIRQIRVKENEKILKYFRKKISNKCLLSMTPQEAQEAMMKCAATPDTDKNAQKKKIDALLLNSANYTINDIIADSIAIAQVQAYTLNDFPTAIKTLKNTQKIIKQNPYYVVSDEANQFLQKQIDELNLNNPNSL